MPIRDGGLPDDGEHDDIAPTVQRPHRSLDFEGSLEAPSRWKGRLTVAILCGVVLTIVVLVMRNFNDSSVYAKGVDQLLGERGKWVGRNVRVEGILVRGTLKFTEKPCQWDFDATRGSALLHVRYPSCIKPDTLRDDMPDVGVTAEGKLLPSGEFQATNVLAKCPSKYEMRDKAKNGYPGANPVAPPAASGLPASPPAAIIR